ncbi:uncharacterized protein LOC114531170 isoform X1 [Dendronephthya gigantea]|uniref:uncharacterized protein LOC114531170 isoform X1 n=1 Tax=Dendronephthya gigantea TaxID=151771 RepID=UPI00106C7057|nr:uncharacterized protein LOC114531170 isoform X1 [Dendronephthya gigantea]
MADSDAPSSNINPSEISRHTRSEARREYDKKRDASKVCLFYTFERWRAFKEEHKLKTDQHVAECLLDHYAVRNILCNVETQTENATTMWPLSTAGEQSLSMCSPGNNNVLVLFYHVLIRIFNILSLYVVKSSAPYMSLRSSRGRLTQSDPESQEDTLTLSFRSKEDPDMTLTASEGKANMSSTVTSSTPKSSRRRLVLSQQNSPSLSLRFVHQNMLCDLCVCSKSLLPIFSLWCHSF